MVLRGNLSVCRLGQDDVRSSAGTVAAPRPQRSAKIRSSSGRRLRNWVHDSLRAGDRHPQMLVVATRLILPISLAIERRLTVDELARAFPVYPSLSGSITDAARAMHIVQR